MASVPALPTFPPPGPTGLTRVIASYLYKQYQDDDDLQAFVAAYNQLAQVYLQTMLDLNLPIYTGSVIAGPLLDWVGRGLYGLPRPPLSSDQINVVGPFGTYAFGMLAYGDLYVADTNFQTVTTDDFYKRILTWHLWKADGKVFTVRWLKRRIMRFLVGTNGTGPNIDQTYQVSVTFGTGNNVSIRLLHGLRTVQEGAIGTYAFGVLAYGDFNSTYTPYAPLQYAEILQEAIRTGAVELPEQYVYTVTV